MPKDCYCSPIRQFTGRPEGIQIEPCAAVVRDSWPTRSPTAASGRHGRERRISKRLEAEAIERLVAGYAGGTTAADLVNGTASPRAVCCG
jgi:hypothetical protein